MDEEIGLGRDINLSDLFEEILIDPLEHELLCVLGTDVVVNQQARKRWFVDQDDSGINLGVKDYLTIMRSH
jgi:hypothetical protein